MGKPPPPDADLVRKVLSGNRSAFEELVKRYWERVYVLATHSKLGESSPEDVVQEAFIQAYRRLGSLREPDRFAAWLSQIAIRVCGRLRKRAARSKTVPVKDAAVSGSLESPEREAERRESRRQVRAAVADLDDHYRLVVILRFFEGMSCQDIADQLGEPVGTIWTRLHRANQILREKLGFLSPGNVGGEI
jgi:RNA polymerase sigma-70 factor, ECF subfamily